MRSACRQPKAYKEADMPIPYGPEDKARFESTDTYIGNHAKYEITPNIIRDFCRDAVESMTLPDDTDVDGAIGGCRIYEEDDMDDIEGDDAR